MQIYIFKYKSKNLLPYPNNPIDNITIGIIEANSEEEAKEKVIENFLKESDYGLTLEEVKPEELEKGKTMHAYYFEFK